MTFRLPNQPDTVIECVVDTGFEGALALPLDVVSALCERLLAGGAPGLHFYSLNQAAPTVAICQRLKLPR